MVFLPIRGLYFYVAEQRTYRNPGTSNGMAKSLLDHVGEPCDAASATFLVIRGNSFWPCSIESNSILVRIMQSFAWSILRHQHISNVVEAALS